MAKQMHPKDFLVGAALGGLLGTVSALLLAPKSGKKLRDDINDVYSDLSEKTEDIRDQMAKKGKTAVKQMSSATSDLTDKAKCLINDVVDWVSPQQDHDGENIKGLIMGGLLGSIVGATAGLLLAPKSGDDLRQDLVETYNDVSERAHEGVNELTKKGRTMAKNVSSRTNQWLDVLHDVIQEVTKNGEVSADSLIEKGGELFQNEKAKQIMDWASLGIRVWQRLKK